jgi:hypothetical protein
MAISCEMRVQGNARYAPGFHPKQAVVSVSCFASAPLRRAARASMQGYGTYRHRAAHDTLLSVRAVARPMNRL